MKNLHIVDSYKIWSTSIMCCTITYECQRLFGDVDVEREFNRSFRSMYIEWWLHNIGYYLTKPFCSIEKFRKLNLRFKDVDLEEWQRD